MSPESNKQTTLNCYYIKDHLTGPKTHFFFGRVEIKINSKCDKEAFNNPNKCIKDAQIYQIGEFDNKGAFKTTFLNLNEFNNAFNDNYPLSTSNKLKIIHTEKPGIYSLSMRHKSTESNKKNQLIPEGEFTTTNEKRTEDITYSIKFNFTSTIKGRQQEYDITSITIPLEARWSAEQDYIRYQYNTNTYITTNTQISNSHYLLYTCNDKNTENIKNVELGKRSDIYLLEDAQKIIDLMDGAESRLETIHNPGYVEETNILIVPQDIYEFFDGNKKSLNDLVGSQYQYLLSTDLKEFNAYIIYSFCNELVVIDKKLKNEIYGGGEYHKIQKQEFVDFMNDWEAIVNFRSKMQAFKAYIESRLKVSKKYNGPLLLSSDSEESLILNSK